jgi:hypothetical protein
LPRFTATGAVKFDGLGWRDLAGGLGWQEWQGSNLRPPVLETERHRTLSYCPVHNFNGLAAYAKAVVPSNVASLFLIGPAVNVVAGRTMTVGREGK